MRLQSVQIRGYKRFGDESTVLRVRGRTLAVLGHNESGKTSLLSAIEHMGRNGFAAATEFTDRSPRAAGDKVLSARFTLDDDDAAAIQAALGSRNVMGNIPRDREWAVYKQANGTRSYDAVNELRRDTGPRTELASLLRAAAGDPWDELPLAVHDEPWQARVRAAMERVATLIDRKDQTLSKDTLDALASLRTDVEGWADAAGPSYTTLQEMRQRLAQVDADEKEEAPSYTAAHALFARLPPFITFDEAARLLPSFTPFTEPPSSALINLLAAGGTTFEELASLAGRDDGREALAEEEKQVNLRLEELFSAWSQRKVCSVIQVDAAGVGVIGRDRNAPIPDPPLGQRSEGMRTFSALLAFLHAKKADWQNPPILLVDEAELHLHYDAQADLVQVFERQELAQCVIYTTHSVGCLPEDLGLGLVVVEETGNERSRVTQSFWTGGPGLTPVMLALGATALSFTPARRVVIGEGAHEAILLPSLLRQSRVGVPSHTPLGFQVVGGLSEVSAGAAARLEEEAGTVVYVVDNDAGGRQAAGVLPQYVRDSGRVLTLGEGTDAECIEDFVAATVLLGALDSVLVADGLPPLSLTADALPAHGRAAWISEQLEQAGTVAARTRVAQAAVLAGADGGLAEASREDSLHAFYGQITGLFPSAN